VEKTYLIFSHHGTRYGFDVGLVREIVWLPALSPIEELSPYICGVFNLHGRVIPVLDLCQRFGRTPEPYRLSDRIIVIAGPAGRVGLIVSELHDLATLSEAAIAPARSYQGAGGEARFVLGEAKLAEGLTMLLDIPALLSSAPAEQEPADETLTQEPPPNPTRLLSELFGQLAPNEVARLRQRTSELAQAQKVVQDSALQAYAVIRLENELFALNADLVREFSHLRGIAPVPCCPAHILGNMNLRGDILTVADIRPALGLSTQGHLTEVVVVQVSGLLFGLPASEIVGVAHLAPVDIGVMPAVSERALKAYCSGAASALGQTLGILDQGVATVGGHSIGILDMEKILSARELQVAEEVR
jgi:purine-binding chemotaxis protein CheW